MSMEMKSHNNQVAVDGADRNLHHVFTPLNILHKIGPLERELLRLIENGDVETVQDFLVAHPDANVNVRDYQGRLPVTLAAQNQHVEMVALLLEQPNIILGDSILFAIRQQNYKLVEMMLDFQERQGKYNTETKVPAFHSAEFPAHMTPLIYAAQCDAFEIVQLLLQRGHTITIPDPEKFVQDADGSKLEFGEGLEFARTRIDTYKALGSPSYLALSSSDPILAAFRLSHEADKAAYTDPIFREEYEKLSKQCREFATDLLSECRKSKEVYQLLTKESEEEVGMGSISEYGRLELAVEFEQKEFVSHPNCQQVLQMLWTQNNPDVMWMSPFAKLLYFIPRMLLLPFTYIGYFFLPFLQIWDYWKAPMFKYLGEVMSYIVFLCLIFVSILRFSPNKRILDVNGVDICIYIWVASYIWHYVKVFYLGGFKAFIKHWWFAFDVFTILLFLIAFAGRLASFLISRNRSDVDENLPRKYWPPFDPMLISEGFYCIACVAAFVRVLYWYQMSQFMGPVQISLARMLYDTAQFFLVFLLVAFSFSVGINRNYVYYKNMVQVNNDGSTKSMNWYFESWESTFKTLYWNLYGYGGNDYGDVVVDNRVNATAHTPVIKHHFTEFTGYLLWAFYHLLVVTILLNMLIAMMSNTLSHIQENADMEWKFARAKIWMFYFERGGFIPPPLNLIPTPATIIILVRWFALKLFGNAAEAKFSRMKCCYILKESERIDRKAQEEKYKALIAKLILRYLSKHEQDEVDSMVKTSDLDRVKQDILREIQKIGRAPSRANSMVNLRSPPAHSNQHSFPMEDFHPTISLHVPSTESHHL